MSLLRGKIWRELLRERKQLLLPAAHDALTAKIIEQAGFPAFQVGGFALDGARYGFPDIDLNGFGEKSAVVKDIISACQLPVLIEIDEGYGEESILTYATQIDYCIGGHAIFV